jgi:hypothetical protein
MALVTAAGLGHQPLAHLAHRQGAGPREREQFMLADMAMKLDGPFSCPVCPIDAGCFPSFPDPVLNRC